MHTINIDIFLAVIAMSMPAMFAIVLFAQEATHFVLHRKR